MWTGDDSAFVGVHHRLDRPINSPTALSRPHPPILVGGTGEQKTLRLVAEYADACNVFDIPDGGATIRHKLAVLAKHCDAVGRAYDDVEKTVSTRLGADESPAEFAERCAAFAELGIDQVIVLTTGPWTDESVDRLAAAVPAVEPLGRPLARHRP